MKKAKTIINGVEKSLEKEIIKALRKESLKPVPLAMQKYGEFLFKEWKGRKDFYSREKEFEISALRTKIFMLQQYIELLPGLMMLKIKVRRKKS